MGEKRNAYRGKTEGKRPLGRPDVSRIILK
jgi:hypothetical protein